MMFRGKAAQAINCHAILSVSETVFIVIYRHYKLLFSSSADDDEHKKKFYLTTGREERIERGILQCLRLIALNNMLILSLFEFKIERSIMFL